MKTRLALRLLAAVLALLPAACFTPGNRVMKSLDRSRPLENSNLWRKVGDQPLAYVPRAWPQGQATTAQRGEWLKDPQDGAAYFVPRQECGGRSPGVWRGEAVKSTNRYTLQEQTSRNAATLLIGLPLEITAMTLAGMGR